MRVRPVENRWPELILFIALRRWIDVALTLVPLLVAIVVTLEICVLIGLQLRDILEGLSGYSVAELALYAVLVSLAVVLTRVFWVFPATYVPRVVSLCL